MSTTIELSVKARRETGKGVARKLRAQAQIPAVLYGLGAESRSLTLDAAQFRHAISSTYGRRVLLRLKFEGEKEVTHAIVKDIQKHPLSRNFLHADLLAVQMDRPIVVRVPLRQKEGIPYGVKNENGVLEWMLRDVLLRVLPEKIPAAVEVDVVPLKLGQRITAQEAVGGEFELETPGDTALCHVVATRMSVEVATVAGEEGEEGAEGEAAVEGEEGEAKAAEDDKKSQD